MTCVARIGWSGVFRYALSTGDVQPILLEPSFEITGQRIEYRNPQVTSDGTLFITGLESESGSVGADGPVYRVTGWE